MSDMLLGTDGSDHFSDSLELKQKVAWVEMFGLEARNRYVSTDDAVPMYIKEESTCCQRNFCGPHRELTMHVFASMDESGEEIMQLHKPFNWMCCGIWCRPEMQVKSVDGETTYGVIEDPCACCEMNLNVKDANDELKYQIHGGLCQLGLCCPLCADVTFDVLDPEDHELTQIIKPATTCLEAIKKTNRFRIEFPHDSDAKDKALLVGAMMHLDLQYFEAQQNDE